MNFFYAIHQKPQLSSLKRPLRRIPFSIFGLAIFIVSLGAQVSLALPTGPRGFCDTYAAAPICTGQLPSCKQCHDVEPVLNVYGQEVQSALAATAYAPNYADREAWMNEFETYLPQVLPTIEENDPDGDGISSLAEIEMGTEPGNFFSVFSPVAEPTGLDNPNYDVMQYDMLFAFRRVSLNYCGQLPTFDEMELLKLSSVVEQEQLLHEKLDTCVGSDHWRKYALERLADNRIRPISWVGRAGPIIRLGDYYADYRLFSHVMTGSRDARDLLLADYHIDHEGNVVDSPSENPRFPSTARVEQQPVEAPQRAGMITTRWFMVVNTMFSHIPRTTAAQTLRAYLGQDIGKNEGLRPTPGEPTDPDQKGVTEEACARCHSTLDPLAYAFTYYDGINIGSPELSGRFNPDRVAPEFASSVTMEIYNTPITDAATRGVRGLAEIAVTTDDFKRNLVNMMLMQVLQRELTPDEYPVLKNLMDTLDADGFNVNALLHRIVDTDLFGRP